MVSLKTAITEIDMGAIKFDYPGAKGNITEDDVVSYLKRLEQYEDIGLEPEELRSCMLFLEAALGMVTRRQASESQERTVEFLSRKTGSLEESCQQLDFGSTGE